MRGIMEILEKKISELQKAGKLNKFAIYIDILNILFDKHDPTIYEYFDDFLKAMQEYLEFDDNPDLNLRKQFGQAMNTIFAYARFDNDVEKFHKYLPEYEKYQDYIEDDLCNAKIFQSFGFMYWLQEDFRNAVKCLKQSLDLVNSSGDVQAIPQRYTNLGYIYESKGDFAAAEKYYLMGMDYANQNNYQKAMHLALAALARIKMAMDKNREAIEFLTKALDLMDEDSNRERLSALQNIACCYDNLKQYDKAMEYFKMMPMEWLLKNNPESYFHNLLNIASVEKAMGKYQAAEEKLLQVEKYAIDRNIQNFLLYSVVSLGAVYAESGQYEKAVPTLKRAIKLAEEKDNQKELNRCYLYLAEVHKNMKQFSKAIETYNKALQLSKKQKLRQDVIKILHDLAECFFQIKESAKAYKTLQKYVLTKEKNEESLKEKEVEKETSYEAGRSRQHKFSEGFSMISRELSEMIGSPIIGNSTALDNVIQKAYLASRSSDASVLLLGESGSGKDLFAKLIHYASIRHKGPFIAVNSSVFSAGLVQSALFGHKKGAFTGAAYDHKGYFEEANKGSIFLDEISEMPSDIQANLLRILEQKVIKRMGDNANHETDFRLISASNRDMNKLLEQNRFRFDLFNRINTIEIHIPPLRSRKDDIPLLIEYFIETISERLQKESPQISQPAINMLCDYDFPGNVRELKNMIERLILFSKNNKIDKEDIFSLKAVQTKTASAENLKNLNLKENERELISEAMRRSGNVQVKAAKLLGISTYTLNRRLKKIKD